MEEKKKRKKKYYPESAKKWRERNPDYKKQWLLKNPGYNKDGYNNDPVKRRRYHKARCWAELGIDFKQVEDALISQGNKCAGCSIELTMDSGRMDHCHETGVFRGVLCNCCNLSLGRLKDSPETLRRLADYVERFKK